ncbi:MinD/ParA family protein [Candidatus Bathyarchaeota archaeon]|nr:MAG: MinD/ParA family protein [Candidatus Bathyarchaeota archaeon]
MGLVIGLATILAVQSFKGGTGKSTVSANLAVTLARLGKRVAVIDLDLEGPGLHVIFGISDAEIKVTINDVLQSAIPIRDAVLDLTHRLGIDSGCLLFCPAGHRLEEILKMVDTGFNLSRFKAVLYSLATEYQLDYLLIDSHPGIEKDTIVSMAVCDVVVLLSRVDHQDMFGSGVMNEVATQLRKPVVLILNMIPSSVGENESKKIGEKIASLFNLQVLTALPFNSDVFENLSRGVFVLEHQKDPLTRKFTELAENMIGIIDRALEGEESYDHGSTPRTVG